MPTSIFTSANSNQRVVHIPITPISSTFTNLTGAGTTTQATITLGANSLNGAGAFADLYVYYAYLYPRFTAAASSLSVTLQWQFQNAAHAAVGGATGIHVMSAGCGGATAVLSPAAFAPAVPQHYRLAVAATVVEVAFQFVVFGVVGAPSVDAVWGIGVDITNTGPTGDIGGGGLIAQSSTNANTF